jgi:hypothetical protein
MTDYAWFPVTGDGESAATAYTWNVGQLPFSTGNNWANVDINPPYPIETGTVPGAVSGGVAEDSAYIFSGAASGTLVDKIYTPDPAEGDPYIAKDASGNYTFPTEIDLNSGTVALDNLGMESFSLEDSVAPPTLEIEAASLLVLGSIESTFDSDKYPAGLGNIVATGEEFGFDPTPGGNIDIGQTGTVAVVGTIGTGVNIAFGTGTGNLLDLLGVTEAAATNGIYTVGADISFFGTGDEIDLANIASTNLNSYTYNAATGVLDVNVGDPTDIMITVSGTTGIGVTGGLTQASFHLGDDGKGGLAIVACYAAGTRIATTRGEVAVEALTLDDQVLTAESGPSAIRWIGHRSIDLARHATPERVQPIRVRAGTFGEGLPRRDLVLSPDHAVFVEDVLIPIKHLVNGHSITRLSMQSVTYFHVELARHEIILAEGLPAESYLDTGDRTAFSEADAPLLHPVFGAEARDIMLIHEALACAPLRITGPEVEQVRARLATVAEGSVAA